MPDAYYRISASKSDFDVIVYAHDLLAQRLKFVAPSRKEGIPTLDDIRQGYRFPLKKYRPMCLIANDIFRHTTNSNSFELSFGGDIEAQKWLEITVTQGEVTPALGASVSFGYTRNLAATLLKKAAYKVASDEVNWFSGHAFFVFTQLFVNKDMAPAIARMTRELVVDFEYAKYTSVSEADDVAQTMNVANLQLRLPHIPASANRLKHPQFSMIIPLDLLSGSYSAEEAIAITPIHTITRYVEFELNEISDCINVVAQKGAATASRDAGFANISRSGLTGVYTWASTPSVTAVRPALYVNYLIVHRDLQQIIAFNPYAYVIHRMDTQNNIIQSSGSDSKTFALVRAIEYVALIHTHSKYATGAATGASTALTVEADTTDVATQEYCKIDPFFVDTDKAPIQTISIQARGNSFYKELPYETFSTILPYYLRSSSSTTFTNRALCVIPMCQKISITDFEGSYNSGYGPDLAVQWNSTIFDNTNPGLQTAVIFSSNVVAAYRGVFVIRFP